MANEKDLQNVQQKEVKEVAKTTNKKVKNLTVTELKKKSKELGSQTEHTIKVGDDEYKIKIDDTFRQTKQHKVMEDLIDFLNEGNSRLELLEVATPYTSLLLIKHFTSLEVPNDIDGAIEVLNALVDLGILGEILNLMPEQEVVKIYETLSASVDRMNKNIEEMREEARKLADKLENKEVKELLEDGEK